MKGRKVDTIKKDVLSTTFKSATSRQDFVQKVTTDLGIKKATANVYWYNLCKVNKVKPTEKRGRPSSNKLSVVEKLIKARNAIQDEIEKAKASKKSTTTLRAILDIINS